MNSMLWTALLLALAVGSVVSSPSSSELGDIIRRLEAAEAEITALKDNKAAQEKEITDLKSLVSQVRDILLNISLYSACCFVLPFTCFQWKLATTNIWIYDCHTTISSGHVNDQSCLLMNFQYQPIVSSTLVTECWTTNFISTECCTSIKLGISNK